MIVLIFLTIQVALYLYGRSVALQAAREGVSIVRLAQDQDAYRSADPGAMAYTEQFASSVGRQSLFAPDATSDYDDRGGTVSVTVTGNVVSLLGFKLPVRQTAFGTIERFDPDEPAAAG